jgi:hypothetical protein
LRDAGKLPSSAEVSSDQKVWANIGPGDIAIPKSEAEYSSDQQASSPSLPAERASASAASSSLPAGPTNGLPGSSSLSPGTSPTTGLRATQPVPRPVAIADRYDVFVSYCREDGATIARLLADKITAEGYRVFLDVEGLGSGSWSQELQLRINECPDFVVVLTAAYIGRLRSNGSVIQQEVAAALEHGQNIVPVLVETMPSADQLPASVAALPDANGIRYVHEYTDAVVIKLCAMLRSARLTGPERLRTGEAEPRAIVACVAMLIGVIQGAANGSRVGGGWGVISATLFSLFSSFAVFGFLLPVALILLGVGSMKGIRRDRLYLGPWLPFWALFIPVLMMAVSVMPTAAFMFLQIRSLFWGGIAGMAIALGLTALLAFTNTWGVIRGAFGGRR